jgi:hypothetical protein
MTLTTTLQKYLAATDRSSFMNDLMLGFVEDAKKRNPDAANNDNMLIQLARPKYLAALKELNAELESLKIVNRRTNG